MPWLLKSPSEHGSCQTGQGAAPHHQDQVWERGLTLPMSGEDMEPPGPQFHLTGNTHWAQRELLLMFALVLF